jgi:hypothetical protein
MAGLLENPKCLFKFKVNFYFPKSRLECTPSSDPGKRNCAPLRYCIIEYMLAQTANRLGEGNIIQTRQSKRRVPNVTPRQQCRVQNQRRDGHPLSTTQSLFSSALKVIPTVNKKQFRRSCGSFSGVARYPSLPLPLSGLRATEVK